MTVVVIVSPHATEAIRVARNTGLFGEVGESAVTVVAVECVPDLDAASTQIAAIHEVNILKSVAIVVCNADTRSRLLEYRGDSTAAFEMDKPDPRRFSDIGE